MKSDDHKTKPVFLHGMWRSGSTYIWSKFRACPDTYCFYEPLNQGLERLTAVRIGRDTGERMQDNAHPEMEKPYFEEFRPFLNGRGVPGFKKALAYKNYILSESDKYPALEQYIRSLIENARGQGGRPVLGFNRMNLRQGWLRRRLGGVNIYIDRDPVNIWHSYMRHAERGNDTYFTQWFITLEQNRDHPFLKPLNSRLNLRSGLQYLTKPKPYYAALIRKMSAEELYGMVFYLWTLCVQEALCHSDLIIDISRSAESGYLESIARKVSDLTGLSQDFSDMVAASAVSELLPGYEEIEQRILPTIPLHPGYTGQGANQLSPRKAALLQTPAAR